MKTVFRLVLIITIVVLFPTQKNQAQSDFLDKATRLSWSSDGKHVALLQRVEQFTFKLLVADSDGKNLHEVGKIEDALPYFQWSPDNIHLAFSVTVYGPLYIVDLDGSSLQKLIPYDVVDPAWSPDGKYIAFSYDTGTSEANISTISVDNAAEIHKLTTDLGGHNIEPKWSPDGQQIIFIRQDFDRATGHQQVFIMKKDGSDKRLLTSQRIFPDDSWFVGALIFVSGSLVPEDIGIRREDRAGSIFIIDEAGSNFRRWRPDLPKADIGCFAPDGKKMAYYEAIYHNIYGGDSRYTANLYIIDDITDSTSKPILVDKNLTSNNCSWSPDSNTLAYDQSTGWENSRTYLDLNEHIFLVDSDGSNRRPFPFDLTGKSFPSWQPDK